MTLSSAPSTQQRLSRTSDLVAAHAASIHFTDIPEAARTAAAVSLMDAVGGMLAASGLGEGCAAFAQLVLEEGGRPDSSLIGFGGRVPAAAAALANGALSHALDFEDSIDDTPVHPNAQVIPAVLALAEQRDTSGERLIAAIAVGCDLTVRFGRAAGDLIGERGWYPPPILGALGATAACANLIGLNERQTLDALSLVLHQMSASGEIKHSPLSVIRGVRDSFASYAAVRACQLAERGIRGFDQPLEGSAGFFATYAGADADLAAVTDDLGSTFAGANASYKLWPSCRGTHSFIEAALTIREGTELATIESIALTGAPLNVMLANPLEAKRAPTTAIDAKFSLPFTVATAFVDGQVTLGSFSASALQSSRVLDIARRVTFAADPAFGMTSGRMTVTSRDGSVRTVDVDTPRGNPGKPVSILELREKFVSCAAAATAPFLREQADRAARALLDIASAPGVRDLLASVTAAGPSRQSDSPAD